ncbi:MAG: hypothetical protein IIB00_01575 [candidate division Zixibacteria bacterium]|nr:hypothetical protein [candidate division Zixibacteria bacterium]
MNKRILILLASFLLLANLVSDTEAQSAKSQAGSVPLKERNLVIKPLHTEISPRAELEFIVVKFTDESEVRKAIGKGGSPLVSLRNRNISEAEAVLKVYLQASRVSSIFAAPVAELDAQRKKLQLSSGLKLADMAGYYQIAITDPAEAMIVINQLNALDIVEIAYPMPKPEPAVAEATTPDFVAAQTYLNPAPDGVDADYAFL